MDVVVGEGRREVEDARARLSRGEATAHDHHVLAAHHYRAGAFKEALERVEAARALGARGATAYLLGLIHREAGRLLEASAAFEAAAREAKRDDLKGRALAGLGTALCLLGQAREALEPLEQAVELRPDLTEAWHNLGVAAVRARVFAQAQRAFSHLARTDAASREAYLALLVDVGRAAGLDEMRTQGHRIKNLVSLLGDESRRLSRELAARGDDPAAALGARLATGVEGLFKIMQRYLAAMREEPLELDLIDVNDLVARCLFAASSTLEGLRVERRLAPSLPEVVGDRVALEEVLLNVLLNGADAVRERPARAADGDADLVIATGSEGTASVVLSVSDRGPGIDPERREQIFMLGYTTKPHGSGIGLSQVRKVVRTHGGDVRVSSSEQGGACFSIVLPIRPPGEARLALLSVRSPLFEDLREVALTEPRADELATDAGGT